METHFIVIHLIIYNHKNQIINIDIQPAGQ